MHSKVETIKIHSYSKKPFLRFAWCINSFQFTLRKFINSCFVFDRYSCYIQCIIRSVVTTLNVGVLSLKEFCVTSDYYWNTFSLLRCCFSFTLNLPVDNRWDHTKMAASIFIIHFWKRFKVCSKRCGMLYLFSDISKNFCFIVKLI